MIDRRMVLIGGGEMKSHETIEIDRYIAMRAKERAGDRRACGLFIPTASHDCMPYYNTFHKIYTSMFNIKTDVVLTVQRAVDSDKIKAKFDKADFIYVGGGNTVFMMEHWGKVGLLPYIRDAYQRGVILCGLSAGAICWFEEMYSDSVIEGDYSMHRGFGWLPGKISPHYNERMLDFDETLLYNDSCAWALENNVALEIVNEIPTKSISSGGKVYFLETSNHMIQKTVF